MNKLRSNDISRYTAFKYTLGRSFGRNQPWASDGSEFRSKGMSSMFGPRYSFSRVEAKPPSQWASHQPYVPGATYTTIVQRAPDVSGESHAFSSSAT